MRANSATIFCFKSSAANLVAVPVTYVVLDAYEPGSKGTTSVSASYTTIISIGHPNVSQAICASTVFEPCPISVEPVKSI